MTKCIKSTRFSLLVLIIVATFFNSLEGQQSLYFEHLDTDDGLSQSDVNTIYEDQQGYMWFGTHEGLNKYDGYSFSIYNPDHNNPDSISSNLVYSITGDENGNLWIGTTGHGLNYFDKSKEKFIRFYHEEENNNSLINDHIRCLYRDKKNRLWIGTRDGLDMVNLDEPLDSLVFKHYNLIDDASVSVSGENGVFSIFEDSFGQVWIGGFRGLYKLNEERPSESYFDLVNNEVGLPQISVRSLNEDKFGRLFIGTGGGLYLKKNTAHLNEKAVYLYGGFINTILIEEEHIWIGTNNGILYFENSSFSKKPQFKKHLVYNPKDPNSLSKNVVKVLYKDRTGIVWVGTNGGGANKYDPQRKRFDLIKKTLDPNSLSYDKIRSMYEDSNGALWIGTEGGGLNMLPKYKNNDFYSGYVNFNKIAKPFVTIEVQRDDKKILLIGAEGTPGLYELDITNPELITEKEIKKVDEISPSVFALLEDSNKNIWIGTYQSGVYRWLYDSASNDYKKDNLSNKKTDSFSISDNIIRNIFEDRKGNLWFATGAGLNRLRTDEINKKNPKFDVFKNNPSDENSISHDYILEIFESRSGDLWIGTLGGGLNKFIESSSTFKSFKTSDGLPNNVIKGILEDEEGNLWLSTNKGLSKFNPTTLTFKNYDIYDGLQSNEFQELARLKLRNGDLLFGGIKGFNAFNPREIKDNAIEAETVITHLTISNKPVEIGEKVNGRVILNEAIEDAEEIALKYKENSFSFEFAALHFAAPQKNQFAYMLEGFDEDWIYADATKRFATYTNLEPNTYTLKVKASNNDGVWDKTPSQINIRVIPPFYRTNLAYLIYSLLALGLLMLFRRFTVISTTKKYELELEHVENERAEELQRIKLEFFTNISHEFKTPLTLIQGPLKYLQKKGKDISEKALFEQYGLMQKNSEYLLRLVNQLLDFRKINQGKMRLVMRHSDIVYFVKEVSEPFQFLAQKNQIEFKVIAKEDTIKTWFDHEALEKIVNNLLSNAFKYTSDNGRIYLELTVRKRKQDNAFEKEEMSRYIEIKVSDTGIGIDSSKIDSVFERFYTERNEGRTNSEGIGIGLSFVRDIVELHRGNINVESEVGIGTVFTVKLPMNKAVYENNPEIICKDISDSDFYTRTSETDSLAISINDDLVDQDIDKLRSEKPVLLVVDDNADIRNFLKQTLNDEYIVYEAENGKIGLDLANKLIPNIILTDVLMPEMDGIEFCKKIKNQSETSHIPVIILTAKLSQESELKGLKTGADDYMRKPFDIELLEVKLDNIIKFRNKLRERFNNEITFEPKDVTVTSSDEVFLQQAVEVVEDNMMNTDFNVEMLVKEMGLSRTNIYLKFKEITGLSSSEFIRNIRLKRAVQLFEKSDFSVKEIMHLTGFNTASYFAKCFKKQFGVTPSEYVLKNKKEKHTQD